MAQQWLSLKFKHLSVITYKTFQKYILIGIQNYYKKTLGNSEFTSPNTVRKNNTSSIRSGDRSRSPNTHYVQSKRASSGRIALGTNSFNGHLLAKSCFWDPHLHLPATCCATDVFPRHASFISVSSCFPESSPSASTHFPRSLAQWCHRPCRPLPPARPHPPVPAPLLSPLPIFSWRTPTRSEFQCGGSLVLKNECFFSISQTGCVQGSIFRIFSVCGVPRVIFFEYRFSRGVFFEYVLNIF